MLRLLPNGVRYDFWPRGTDSRSRAQRLETTLIIAWCALWLVAGVGIIQALRRFCQC